MAGLKSLHKNKEEKTKPRWRPNLKVRTLLATQVSSHNSLYFCQIWSLEIAKTRWVVTMGRSQKLPCRQMKTATNVVAKVMIVGGNEVASWLSEQARCSSRRHEAHSILIWCSTMQCSAVK